MTLGALRIAGSCVSRDTYELELKSTFVLRRYTARQSLISAMNSAVTGLPLDDMTFAHRFHQRMFEDDLNSSLRSDLADLDEPTVLLLDVVDERHGVFRVGEDAYVTRSVETIDTPVDHHLRRTAVHIPFGSDEHVSLWADALARLLRLPAVQQHADVVLLDVPWASRDSAGRVTPTSYGTTADQANASTLAYVAAARAHPPLLLASLSPEEAVADPGHRWGAAPFHYTQNTYAAPAHAIVDVLEDAKRR